MGAVMLAGVTLTSLKRIAHPQGDILHAMKRSSPGFTGFGEAYFSLINTGEVKGWKKHRKMTLNLVVPVGAIRFVLYDDRNESPTRGQFDEVVLSAKNYCRLTVPPGITMAFQGIDKGLNLLLNLADIEHDPTEATNIPLDDLDYTWNR